MTNPVIPMRPPYTPELLLLVQMVTERILSDLDHPAVFEFGSGFSTVWLAGFSRVVTVEHDALWYAEVNKALEQSDRYARAHLVPEADISDVITRYEEFDLVLVDCVDAQRNEAARKAMSHVKPGGWLLLDDSHWPMLGQARKLLSAWPVTIIKGAHRRHTGIQRDHQTSFYQRPPNV